MLNAAMNATPSDPPISPRVVGRYALFDEIAAGGMATVHLGRLVGQVGFSRTVAVKRLHPQYAKDAEFVTMFVDEARLASRIQHPNVVSTLDVVKTDEELFLVMEYVQGEALSKLVRNAAKRGERIPPNVVASILSGMLHGLHAAHEAKSETREPLNIVHRDISPQNVLVGTDGGARVLDFGVAKAAMRSGATRDGQMKGKLSYMSPEQLNGREVDRRSDIFAAGVVLWEALAGKRLFAGADAGEILAKVLAAEIPTPIAAVPSLTQELSDVVMRSLERDPEKRFQTARDFAIALEQAGPVATTHNVGEWVKGYGGEELLRRQMMVQRVESHPVDLLSLNTGRDEVSTKSESTSGVLVPVDNSGVSGEARRPRGVVTLTLLVLGAAVGVLTGKQLLFTEPGPSPAGVPPAVSVASPAETVVVIKEVAPPEPTSQALPTATAKPSSAPTGQIGRWPLPPRPPKPPKKNCDPPFTVDPVTGIKKPKPQCM
jgi:eukaryotic-like serine/threonine-protein kinase